MPTLAWACARTPCESGMAKQVWPWHPAPCWASIALRRQRFIGPHTVPALSGSPPWATAKSDQRFDALEQAGELVALPRPCADGTSILAEIRVERCPTACIFSHLSVPREPGQTQIMNDEKHGLRKHDRPLVISPFVISLMSGRCISWCVAEPTSTFPSSWLSCEASLPPSPLRLSAV